MPENMVLGEIEDKFEFILSFCRTQNKIFWQKTTKNTSLLSL